MDSQVQGMQHRGGHWGHAPGGMHWGHAPGGMHWGHAPGGIHLYLQIKVS